MKKSIILIGIFSLLGFFVAFQLPENMSAEMTRVYNAIQDADYEVAIIDNPNYGSFSSNPGEDIIMSGMTEPDDNISISLNGILYTPATNGQWLRQDIKFKDYIGKNVNVVIKAGNDIVESRDIYVSKAHLVNPLIDENQTGIYRTGNTLSWTPDNSADAQGYVILLYRLYNGDSEIIETDAIALEDNGSYNIDALLSNTVVTRIGFELISGNAVAAMINDKKLLFYINTRDHHMYRINND